MRVALVVLLTGCGGAERAVVGPDADPWGDGAAVYASCASCHLADGGGRPDGAIPRLAGQPAPIVAGKLRAIAAGEVDLPVMVPFARALSGDEVDLVAAHVAALPEPARIGHGAGDALDVGAAAYTAGCSGCHGGRAEGVVALRAPRLCGQHAGYLARRMDDLAAVGRGGDAAMAVALGALSDAERAAVADHLSRCAE